MTNNRKATMSTSAYAPSESETQHLRRCVELAGQALATGNAPFGSVLVDATGHAIQEDHNRTVTHSDASLHPEFTLALWAQQHLTPEQRAAATVYTSGEHCPMCAALHAAVGLGRIVYVSSSQQLQQWRQELGITPGPVAPLAINAVAPGVKVEGPFWALAGDVRELHRVKQERLGIT